MSRQIKSLGFALLGLTAKTRINQSLQTSSVLNLIDEDDSRLPLTTLSGAAAALGEKVNLQMAAA